MHVVGRIDRGGHLTATSAQGVREVLRPRRLPASSVFRVSGAERPLPHADDGEPRLLAHAVRAWSASQQRRRSRSRQAAGRTRRTPRGAGRLARIAQLHHHLAGFQCIRQHAGEEFFGGQFAPALLRWRSPLFRPSSPARSDARPTDRCATRCHTPCRDCGSPYVRPGRSPQPAAASPRARSISQQLGMTNHRADGQAVGVDLKAC